VDGVGLGGKAVIVAAEGVLVGKTAAGVAEAADGPGEVAVDGRAGEAIPGRLHAASNTAAATPANRENRSALVFTLYLHK
jgi:hypothetical protein